MLILNYEKNALQLFDSFDAPATDKLMPVKPTLEDFWKL